ncbi:MAG: ABC transporter ATP-binding protein [Eubacteriales bacterium]|nr:ABC transporter ATP-binding protein [Eubacteriales bacterium]
MKEYIIRAEGLSKKYGAFTALDKVDIHVSRGDIYGLIGDNGAGKTTFLKLAAGQIFPDGGELSLFGEHLPKEMEKSRKRTGTIIEAPGFYPQLTIGQNMEYYRLQKGIPGKACVDEILDLTGLLDKKDKRARYLSMGMKQRLGLAIAMLGEPELLILDEPINGLDPSGIMEIRSLLHRLNQEKNITIILSSHILSELEQLACVYGFLSKGCLMEEISAERLKERCNSFVEIQVDDAERYTVLLEKLPGEVKYQVLPDHTIRIYQGEKDCIVYSRLASENNIGFCKLELRQLTLEQYYMNMKRREGV